LKRRLYRAIVVGYFGALLLAGGAYSLYQEYVPDEVFEEDVEEIEEVDDEKIDIPKVTLAMYEDRHVDIEETKNSDGVPNPYPYYYDISPEGYISEDSLRTCCIYIGQQFDVDPAILMAFAKTESNYDIYAVGSSNDSGLCQIVPEYNKDRMNKLGTTDIFDPIQNLSLCADLIKEFQDSSYGYDLRFVAMAYNMGKASAKELYAQGTISAYAKRIIKNYNKVRYLYE
jgi:soluble lytic murein transglycosylase-like protein